MRERPVVRLVGMAKVTIEVSEELAALIVAAEAKLEEQAQALHAADPPGCGRPGQVVAAAAMVS